MTARICEQCGCELPEKAPEGLCPGCLLAGAIKLPPEAVEDLEPEAEAEPGSPAAGPGEQAGDVIDRYRLMEQIGEGGMGVVYRAEQIEPLQREVALKVIKLGMNTREVVARFETERQALALMDHSHIAHMFDAGATASGRPYFVMELVKGIPITGYCDRNKLQVRERLELFQQVCEAIQHAHQKGVIHRDIKPSNVLVALQDGIPFPKVIDFGVAKATQQRLTEQTMFTRSGQMIGTPEYMSPEQAEMSSIDVDTRSDVYSLGVLLYELLTGGPPFEPAQLREAGLHEVCRIIREVEPAKPSTRISTLGAGLPMVAARRSTGPKKLGGLMRGELDWVVMKTLEKDRTRRYETVSSLAADIRHYLSGEPVEAGPPTAIYRLHKLVRRHKRALAAVALVFLALVAGVITTSWQAVRAARAERHAQEDADRATRAERHAEGEAAIAKAVNEFISEDLLSQANPWVEPDWDVSLREVVDRAAATVEDRFKDQPLVEAGIRLTLARTYSGLGKYTIAETHARRAVEIRKNALGEEHLDTCDSLSILGGICLKQGQDHYPEVEKIYLGVVKIRNEVLGHEHPKTLGAQFSLANIYWLQRRYPEAEDLILKALEIQQRVMGKEHPDTLGAQFSLATVHLLQGRHREAEDLFHKVLEIQQRVLGPEHPSTLISMSNLAAVYTRLGRYPQAEQLCRDVIDIRSSVQGVEHPDTLKILHNLALIYAKQGRYPEAEKTYKEVVDILNGKLGPEHPGTLNAQLCLANAYWQQGHYREAEKIYQEAVEIRQGKLGPEHPETLSAQFSLATVRWLQGHYNEAENSFDKVLGIQEIKLGKEHPATLTTQGNLALVYRSQGRFEEAEALNKQVIKSRSKVLGPEHPDTLDTRHNQALVYESQGRYEEAEALNQDVLKIRMRVLGEENPDTLKSLLNQADGYMRRNRYPDAEQDYREVAKIGEEILGPGHPVTLSARHSLAEARIKQGRYELKPEYYGGYLNRAEAYIMTGKYVEAADSLDECLPLAQKTKDILVWNYLRAVSACLLDRSTADYESKIESATKGDRRMTWSFEAVENWLQDADISEEKKQFITELTEHAKAKQESG